MFVRTHISRSERRRKIFLRRFIDYEVNVTATQQQPIVDLASQRESVALVERQIALAKTLDARIFCLPGDHDMFLTHRQRCADALVDAVTGVQQVVLQ